MFSPTVNVVETWKPVKEYITDVMKVDAEKEQVYYEEYDPVSLKKIIDTQHKVIDFQKKNKQKDLFSVLIVVDDFSDDPKFVRYSNILHGLFTRGRHNAISTILSTQKYNVLEKYQANREEQLAKSKKYYQDNIEERRQTRNRLCNCICGETYTYANKARHEQTNKHHEYLNTLETVD